MTVLPPLPSVRDLIRLYRLRARKQLSQNFLLDLNITKKIVKKAGNLNGAYVGPGPGAITRGILEAGVNQLTVIEKDDRFIPGLQMLNDASGRKMRIFNADVLDYDTGRLFPREHSTLWHRDLPPFHIIGNLPFNVSTPILVRWLRSISLRSQAWSQGRVPMTLTFQKEVSVVGDYAIAVRRQDELYNPRNLSFDLVEKLIRNVFHMRQKMCKHGLRNLFPESSMALDLLRLAEVDGDSRSFALHVEEFNRLAVAYEKLCRLHPDIRDFDFRRRRKY